MLSENVSVGAGSQPSVAVGVANTGVAGHSIVLSAGSIEITGPDLSATLIVWVAVELLPQWSVAVQVRVCATGQVPLMVSTKVSVGAGSQPSVAVGVANAGVAGHSIVLEPGRVEITGPVLSATLIVWVAVEVLPQWSVAVQVRVCATGQVPLMLSAKVSVGAGSQPSVAVGVANAGVAGHSIVVSAGRVEIAGPVLSATLIV